VVQKHAYERIYRLGTIDRVEEPGELVFAPLLSTVDRSTEPQEEHALLASLVGQPVDVLVKIASRLAARGKAWRGI